MLAPAMSPLPVTAVLRHAEELPAALPTSAGVEEGALHVRAATLGGVIFTGFALSLRVEEKWLIRMN